MTVLLDAALEYAGRGWRVFPIKPMRKTPLTDHGVKDATTDEETIRGWWQQWPAANIGFATGDGITVVDIDELGSWTDLIEDENVPSPDTSRVETSRGFQLYFRTETPIRNSAGKLRPGIDVRGDGGYVILPPSVHPSGHIYRWDKNGTPDEIPAWLHELLTAAPKPKPARIVDPGNNLAPGDDTPYGLSALQAEAAIVAGAQEGYRRDRLNTAALKLGGLIAGGYLDEQHVRAELYNAARLTGLPESEIETTIDNGIEDGKAQPRNAPEGRSAPSVATSNSASQAARTSAQLTWQTLEEVDMRSIVFADKPLLQASAFHLVAGRKGQGKGTLLAEIAARVTRGELGTKRNVVWIGSEDSAAIDIKPRIVAAGGAPARVLIPKDGPWIQLPRDYDAIRRAMSDFGDVGMLVVDPVGNHISGKNSDSETDIRDAIAPLNQIADEYECMTFGVRHLSEKDCSHGVLAAILGSSAWVQVPRAVVAVAGDDADPAISHVQCVAGNRLPAGTPGRMFRIEGVLLPGLENEVTRATWIGDSAKDVEAMLGNSNTKEPSRSEAARELILDILDQEGEQESDALDARIATETGLSVKTVQNVRMKLRGDGLVKNWPQKDDQGTVTRWLVHRTLAPRGTA